MASLQVEKSYHCTNLYARGLQAAVACNTAYVASHQVAGDTQCTDLARRKCDMAVPSLSTATKLENAMVDGGIDEGADERPEYLDSSVHGKGQGWLTASHDKRPPRCDLSPFSATSKFHLLQHFQKHHDQRCFRCTVCAKAFYKSVHLADHMRTHTGERPFWRSICLRQFTQKSAMVRHRLQVHKQGKDS